MPATKDKQEPEKTCFIIMPISAQAEYAVDHFGQVYDYLIKPAVTEAGYKPVQADEVRSANLIHLDILRHLLNADLALCDLSSLNPNVMFELGIRQAFDKPVVLIKDTLTRSPFDISPIRYAEYDAALSYQGVIAAREELKAAITETVQGSSAGEVNSIVRLLGLQAAAMVKSEERPEDARISLIEQNLEKISDEVSKVARAMNRLTTLSQSSPGGAVSLSTLSRLGQAFSEGAVIKQGRALRIPDEVATKPQGLAGLFVDDDETK
jgi:hypothetical protein